MNLEDSTGQDSDGRVEFRLRVTTETDPGALVRILGRIQNFNITPRRVIAETGTNDRLSIEIDILGLSSAYVALLAAKCREDFCVYDAHWHRM